MKQYFKSILLLVFTSIVSFSCQDETLRGTDADFLDYQIIGKEADVEINKDQKSITVNFPSDVKEANNLVAEFEVSPGASIAIGSLTQETGVSTNNYELPFSYLLKSEDELVSKTWKVNSLNNDYTSSWGLGGFMKVNVANDKDYEWYLDQSNTGTYSSINCGPTSTTMAALWSDPDFNFNPVDAREAYRPEGGWWYTSDIDYYLTDKGIPHGYIALGSNTLSTEQIIIEQIDGGNIAILCLDMYYISNGSNAEWHVDKFYTTTGTGWGHFIVVKGYKIVDGNSFFEVYDPYGYSQTYLDGTFKGKNRYYRSKDIYAATSIWWNYAIVVSSKTSKMHNDAFIDNSMIKHNRGK